MSRYSFVLVIDEDPEVREMVSRVLRGIACVIEVKDDDAARHVAGQLLFDVVISDRLDLLRHFRDITPETRRVLLSNSDVQVGPLVAGGLIDGRVIKPWNLLKLRTLVQRLLDPAGQIAYPRVGASGLG
jgi:response regulator RpfG family c-di-GMP phosphodiesterase